MNSNIGAPTFSAGAILLDSVSTLSSPFNSEGGDCSLAAGHPPMMAVMLKRVRASSISGWNGILIYPALPRFYERPNLLPLVLLHPPPHLPSWNTFPQIWP